MANFEYVDTPTATAVSEKVSGKTKFEYVDSSQPNATQFEYVDATQEQGYVSPYSAVASNETDAPKRGIVEDVVKSAGSGFIKGGEGVLRAEQGLTNIVGGAINLGLKALDQKPLEISQIYTEMANNLETMRQENYGDSRSVLGKTIEGTTGLPALIGMMGGGGKAGVLTKSTGAIGNLTAKGLTIAMTKYPSLAPALAPIVGAIGKNALAGGTVGFGVMGALEAQPQGAIEMAKQGAMGALQGKALHMASKLPVIPGTIAAGTAMATPSVIGFATNDGSTTPQDIASQFITGAVFNVATSKEKLSTLRDQALRDASKLPADMRKFVEHSIDMHYATEEKALIETQIKETSAQHKMDITRANEAKLQRNVAFQMEEKKKLDAFGKAKSKVEILKEQAEQKEKFAIDEELHRTTQIADKIGKELDTSATEVTKKINSEQFRNIEGQLENSYGNGQRKIGDIIEKVNPFTNAEEPLFWEKCKADALERAVLPDDPNMRKIQARIDKISGTRDGYGRKLTPDQKDVYDAAVRLHGKAQADSMFGISNNGVNPDAPIRFENMKALVDNIKKGADSQVGEIINNNFKLWVEGKLKGTPYEGKFTELQADYSEVRGMVDSARKAMGADGSSLDVKSGSKFIREATGISPDKANSDILSFMQSGLGGRGMVKGIGDLTSTIRTMNENLSKVETELSRLKDPGFRIAQKAKTYVDAIDSIAKNSKEGLTITRMNLEYQKFVEDMKIENAKVGAQFETKMKDLKMDKQKYDALIKEKRGLQSTISSILYGLVPFNGKLFRLLRAFTMASRNRL